MKRRYGMTGRGQSSYSRNAPIMYINNETRFDAMIKPKG